MFRQDSTLPLMDRYIEVLELKALGAPMIAHDDGCRGDKTASRGRLKRPTSSSVVVTSVARTGWLKSCSGCSKCILLWEGGTVPLYCSFSFPAIDVAGSLNSVCFYLYSRPGPELGPCFLKNNRIKIKKSVLYILSHLIYVTM